MVLYSETEKFIEIRYISSKCFYLVGCGYLVVGGWGILNILVRLRVMKANAVLSINFSFANVQQNSYPLPLFCIV